MLFTQETYKSITRYASEWVPPETNVLARTLGFKQAKKMIGRDIPIEIIKQMQDIKAGYAKRKVQRSLKKKADRLALQNPTFIKFCQSFLTPISYKVPEDEISRLLAFDIDWELVKQKIKHLYYSAFLDTHYWKAIRFHMLVQSGYKCMECGNSMNLQVHHLTYVNHGDEIHHLEDLVVLCAICHNKKHRV